MPETRLEKLSENEGIYSFAKDNIDAGRVLETAKLSASGHSSNLGQLTLLSTDEDPLVRYWATMGLTILKDPSSIEALQKRLSDRYPATSITAAEGLYFLNKKETAIHHLIEQLESNSMMVRLMALNVLDLIGDDAKAAVPTIERIIRPSDGEVYDYWAMRSLLNKFQ